MYNMVFPGGPMDTTRTILSLRRLHHVNTSDARGFTQFMPCSTYRTVFLLRPVNSTILTLLCCPPDSITAFLLVLALQQVTR